MKTRVCLLWVAGLVGLYAHTYATPPPQKQKVQIALLLDTSNSMDGLIDQAKAHLWKLVNHLAMAKKDGKDTDIEIAVFEYGNDNLAMAEGYVRVVSALTNEVDVISEKLFSLKTRGGSEYCGAKEKTVTTVIWPNYTSFSLGTLTATCAKSDA